MKHLLFAFISLSIIFLTQSCSPSKKVSQNIEGTYYGFLPCADCPGISYTLELGNRGKYQLTRVYYDREFVDAEKGSYTFQDGRLDLSSNGKITERFLKNGTELIYLDQEGKEINSALKEYYILYKGDPSRAKMPEKSATKIFKGTGNEPFWMVEITRENTLIFKGIFENEVEVEVPVTRTQLSDDSQSITYHGKEGSAELVLHVFNEQCQDNMSGKKFPARIAIEATLDGEEYQLEGCGEFLNEYELTGIWKLVSARGGLSSTSDVLTLGLYLPGDQFAGNASCNRYFGTIENVTDTYLELGRIGATKMACPDMSLERRFLKFINQESIQWTISKDDELVLHKDRERFVFERSKTL